MSTYAVFGMTKPRAIAIARKALEPWDKENKRAMTPAEYEVACEEHAAQTMAGERSVQLSDKFDAPQFAREFVELAKRIDSKRLRIRAYAPTGAHHPKTGKPVMAWFDCDESGEVIR